MKLEELIQKNVGAFDEEVPAGAWMKIQTRLPRRRKFPIMRYAALLLVCMGMAYYLGKTKAQSEIRDLEKYDAKLVTYASKVQEKKSKLEQLVSSQPDLGETFNKDLTELQNDFNALKAELTTNPNTETIISAMIQNLEWQIELLNQQTQIAEKKVYML